MGFMVAEIAAFIYTNKRSLHLHSHTCIWFGIHVNIVHAAIEYRRITRVKSRARTEAFKAQSDTKWLSAYTHPVSMYTVYTLYLYLQKSVKTQTPALACWLIKGSYFWLHQKHSVDYCLNKSELHSLVLIVQNLKYASSDAGWLIIQLSNDRH